MKLTKQRLHQIGRLFSLEMKYRENGQWHHKGIPGQSSYPRSWGKFLLKVLGLHYLAKDLGQLLKILQDSKWQHLCVWFQLLQEDLEDFFKILGKIALDLAERTYG